MCYPSPSPCLFCCPCPGWSSGCAIYSAAVSPVPLPLFSIPALPSPVFLPPTSDLHFAQSTVHRVVVLLFLLPMSCSFPPLLSSSLLFFLDSLPSSLFLLSFLSFFFLFSLLFAVACLLFLVASPPSLSLSLSLCISLFSLFHIVSSR